MRAAMAHLNVISVHPFRDGNGRVSRIVQSLVLCLDGARAPELVSIEEFLGAHTQDYYAALREVQGGSYQPQRDASSWVTFCVEATPPRRAGALGRSSEPRLRQAVAAETGGRSG